MSINKQILLDELAQRREEGAAVSAVINAITAVTENDTEKIAQLYAELTAIPPDVCMSAQEPSDLDQICALRPAYSAKLCTVFTTQYLSNRLEGAWLGRIAGCLLGKPCEGWEYQRIRTYLESAGAYPLNDYFPRIAPATADGLGDFVPENWLLGNINCAPRDDDTDYTILGLHILEEHGKDFTTQRVADEWLNHLPYYQVYTAERVAYANLVNEIKPPDTASADNPYREWIGAQIRADMWGYVNPGQPNAAAAMAYRDACLSHVKNGIYGEMWVAACLAAALACDDMQTVLAAGLAQIPAHCRLAEALRNTMAWAAENDDWQQTFKQVNAAYGAYHRVHTINNACAVVLALLHGKGDFGKTISIAVMCGWDTDCNGATAGSILGAMLGAASLPSEWVSPLNDTIESAVQGFNVCKISDLASRTLKQAERILGSATK